jgi:hypothetical protein
MNNLSLKFLAEIVYLAQFNGQKDKIFRPATNHDKGVTAWERLI